MVDHRPQTTDNKNKNTHIGLWQVLEYKDFSVKKGGMIEGRWLHLQTYRTLYANSECIPYLYGILLNDQTQTFQYFHASNPEVTTKHTQPLLCCFCFCMCVFGK